MFSSGLFDHPLLAAEQGRLLSAGRGVTVYDMGCGGREVTVVSAALVAAREGLELCVVDSAVLRLHLGRLVEGTVPGLPFRFVSAQLLARRPGACDGAFVVVAAAGAVSPTGASGRHLERVLRVSPHPFLSVHPFELPAYPGLVSAVTGSPSAPVTLGQAAVAAAVVV